MRKVCLSAVWLLAAGWILMGQEMGSFKPVQWVSKSTILTNEKNASRSALVTFGGASVPLPRPARLDGAALQESMKEGIPGDLFRSAGRIYGQTFRAGGAKSELLISALHVREGEGWIKVGEWSHPRTRGRVLIFPLENEQFLAIGKEPLDPNHPNAKKSPFALLRVDDKGVFQCRSLMEVGLPKWHEWPEAAWRLPLSLILHTDDHLVVVMQRYGLYWVFAKDNGRVLHQGRIFGSLTDEAIRKDMVLPLVLHVQPAANGSLIWSTRSEAAVAEGAAGMEDLKRLEAQVGQASPEQRKGWLDAWRQKWAELENRFPEIVWWRFEPENGTFQRLNPAPPGARETRAGLKDFDAFHWVPTPEGRIRPVNLAFDGIARGEETPKAKPKPVR